MSAAAEESGHLADLDMLRMFSVVKAKPSREALENSAEAWAHLIVINAQRVREDRSAENVCGLKAAVKVLESILREMEEP